MTPTELRRRRNVNVATFPVRHVGRNVSGRNVGPGRSENVFLEFVQVEPWDFL